MSRVVKRSAVEVVKTGRQARAEVPLPGWIPPQLCQLVSVPRRPRDGSTKSSSTASA
jgi:hypothetical protein